MAFLSLPKQNSAFLRLHFSLIFQPNSTILSLEFRFTSVKVKAGRAFVSRNTWRGERERERERQSGVGLCWCATLKSKGRFSAFLVATAELTVTLTPQNHTLICYRRSQVDHWPRAANASGAQDSSFQPCDSRGMILLANQLLSVLHYPQVTLLSKDVILLFLFHGLTYRAEQHGNKVVVLDHQTELPQRSWKVLSHDSSYGNSTNKTHWH